MQTKDSREDLEKLKLSVRKHIESIEQKNKELREKQFLLEKLAEKLRLHEFKLNEKIKDLIKTETPYLQRVELQTDFFKKSNIMLNLN